MKKTMVFENETGYDNWFDVNEEKEAGHDFLENRVVIVKGTRSINGKKFNGFSADSAIECKNVRTAVRRFVKELNSNGFEVSVDEFESACNGENLHDLTGTGMVVEVEEIDDDRYYVNYMCYQDEVEEETTATETADEHNPQEILTLAKLTDRYDGIKKILNLGNFYKALIKAIGLEKTKEVRYTVQGVNVFFEFKRCMYKCYTPQSKLYKLSGQRFNLITWRHLKKEASEPDTNSGVICTARPPPESSLLNMSRKK